MTTAKTMRRIAEGVELGTSLGEALKQWADEIDRLEEIERWWEWVGETDKHHARMDADAALAARSESEAGDNTTVCSEKPATNKEGGGE